jgi:hypothetical protein
LCRLVNRSEPVKCAKDRKSLDGAKGRGT